MDRIQYFADLSVRRAAGFGLLAIALVALGLSFEPELAMRASAILLSLEAAILWQLGQRSHRVHYKRREVWLMLDGKHGMQENRLQEIISEVMAQTYRTQAQRLAGPAVAAWIVDLGMRLFG